MAKAKKTITRAELNSQVTALKAERKAVKDQMAGLSKGTEKWLDLKKEAVRLHDEIEELRSREIVDGEEANG